MGAVLKLVNNFFERVIEPGKRSRKVELKQATPAASTQRPL
jgi:hypothetical protein